MTNSQILKEAIEKAVKNGWDWPIGGGLIAECKEWVEGHDYFDIIFSHDFAKAFWKHPKECEIGEPLCSNHAPWQIYLQQMVIHKEPLKYLKKFL